MPLRHDDLYVVPYFAHEKSARKRCWVVSRMGRWREDKWLYVRSTGCVFSRFTACSLKIQALLCTSPRRLADAIVGPYMSMTVTALR